MKLNTILQRCLWLLFLPSVASLAPKAAPKPNSGNMMSRRNALLLGPAALSSAMVLPSQAAAAPESNTLNDLLARLKRVPTFCIVSPEGAAYMVIKRDEGMAKGYAFTTFEGALAVLGDAQRTAEAKGYADVWKDATITTIPADIAIRLALQKKVRSSQKEQTLDTLVDIIPGADEREDALALDRKKFEDQGMMPLFYFNSLQLQEGGNPATPVYFKKQDLLAEWNKQNPGASPPRVQLLDLVDTFQYVLRGKSDELPNNIVFVPDAKAVEVSKEMKSRGLAPYKVDRMIV